MNWKEYENIIFEYFVKRYPNYEVSKNASIIGRYSKVPRQIDILIEGYVAGIRIRIIIDGKYFSENIDVKDVEMFLGMLNDCEANKGLLITQQGYSKASLNRAYYDQLDLDLDILNFKEFELFQNYGGIPYSDKFGVIANAPFGWIIDATRRENMLATFYQRGLTFEEAIKNNEWIYVNIMPKENRFSTIEEFIEYQNKYTLQLYPKAKIKLIPTIKRDALPIRLRSIEIDTYPTTEYTCIVEFKEFFFFGVLFTTLENSKRNIRKLEELIEDAIPLNIKQ
ncbi:MAG TPA: restriction endonuclease [Candidatus Kapabacteria bacterium]|nr:restriction endonuclease [Candidatus Kapabacteria bacterium]